MPGVAWSRHASLLGAIRGSAHAKGLVLWTAALATGILCVWQHIYASRLASEIEALRNTRSRLEAEIGFLEMECVSLSRRERVEEYATQHLGMRYPEEGEVVRLGDPANAMTRTDYVMNRTEIDGDG